MSDTIDTNDNVRENNDVLDEEDRLAIENWLSCSVDNTGEGNIISSPVALDKDYRVRSFIITYNNYTTTQYLSLLKMMKDKKGCKYILAKEVGKKNGTKHLQGYMTAPNTFSWNTLIKNFPGIWLRQPKKAKDKRVYNVDDANYKYCSKGGDFVTNMKAPVNKKRLNLIKNDVEKIYGWQKDAIELIEKTTQREIIWIWSREGNFGKSSLCKYIIDNYKGVIYFTGGKINDITSQILLEDDDPELCIFDFAKDTERNNISYKALEAIKNGLINSSKYKGGFRKFDYIPQILVLANFAPIENKLTPDRWNIIKLKDEDKFTIEEKEEEA